MKSLFIHRIESPDKLFRLSLFTDVNNENTSYIIREGYFTNGKWHDHTVGNCRNFSEYEKYINKWKLCHN